MVNIAKSDYSISISEVKLPKSFRAIRKLLPTCLASLATITTNHTLAEDEKLFELEETIVTAQKRSESLQDVPIAIQSFNNEEMKQRGLTNISQLADFSPNVELDAGSPFSGSAQILGAFIRGIGQGDFAFNLEPGVGVYIDGVYYARSLGSVVDLLDLDHVEILKGPQGTLFGRNSIGGALNVLTRAPAQEFKLQAEMTIGRYDRRDFRGVVDIPLIDDVLLSQVSVSLKNRDGYQKRVPFPSDTPFVTDLGAFVGTGEDDNSRYAGDENTDTVRAKLLWNISDNNSLLLSGDYTDVDEAGTPSTLLRTLSTPANLAGAYNTCISLDPATLAAIGLGEVCGPRANAGTALAGANVDAATDNDRLPYDDRFITGDKDVSYATGPSFSSITSWGVSATLDLGLSNSFDVKLITAYRELDSAFGTDIDGSPIVMNDTGFTMDQEQLSQEIQFSGHSFDDKLDWVLGLYYFHEEGNLTDYPRFGSGLLQIFGPNDFDTDAYALFGHASYTLNDRWSVTMGLRYTEERKEFIGKQRDLNSLAAKFGAPPFVHPDPTDLTLYFPAGTNKQSFNNLSPKFGIEYQLSDDSMAYLSASRGFKSGGWTTRVTGPVLAAPEFSEEIATTYELGLKSVLFDQRLRLNTAVFFTKYEDLQITVQRGVSPFIENAGESEIRGVELDFEGLITQNFTVTGGLGYIDAKYTKLDSDALVQEGFLFANTPEWSATLSGTYETSFSSGDSLIFRVDYSYKSDVANDAENTPLLIENDLTLVNSAITFTPNSENWSVVLGGRNLTDERYIITGLNIPSVGLTDATYSRPREWYLTFNYYY